jgi:phage-related protein
MASSFGGTVKLSGESEYVKALRNINSNLRAVSSELKLASTEFNNNGQKIGDLRTQNDALNKKLKEEKNVVKVCADAIKNFTEQQTKNKTEIDKLKNSLDSEKQALEKMKNSTTASSSEISKQEKVVAELEKELSKAESTYDSNNKKINDYKIKMNNAKSECSDLSKKIGDNNSILDKAGKSFDSDAKSIKDFAKEEENAGQKTLTLGDLIKGNLISEGIIAGIKGLAGAMKSVGSAMLDIGKDAVAGFGEFEQLEGGVKKLFGDDVANTVIANANNAFSTAGMSANEYMETVTGFSKSMIVSLNGDTQKAAKLSDQALRDMSDNANTFGTDMQSIQNAYSGFAKGQFNMLDNLKLGYGGTKTEMERLLKDAEKLTGKKYDVSNFADITEAIHEIQVASNIAGTTQAEAMGTIEGSIKATKSAWSNLITGLATDGADLSQLVMNLFSSLVGDGDGNGGVVNNVLKAVDRVVDAVFEALPMILDGISEQLPAFLESGSKIITKLVDSLTANMPMIMSAVMEIINMLVSTIIQNLPQIMQMGIQLIVSLVQGIAEQLPTLIPQMIDVLVLMVTTLLDNIDLIIDAGIQLILGLADGLINALPDLIDKIPEIIDKLIMAITDNLPKIIEAGITLTVKLAVGLVQAIPQLVAKIPQIIGSLVKGIGNYFGKMLNVGKELLGKVKDGIVSGISGMANVGKDLVKGLWNGIKNAKDWVMDKIKGFGSSIVKGIKGIFGIHSPSTVFRDEIGSNLAKGIGVGFTSEMNDVNSMIQNSLPTDFDISSNVNLNNNLNKVSGINTSYLPLISAFQEALDGMAFKIDGEKMGELIISDVERVIYS